MSILVMIVVIMYIVFFAFGFISYAFNAYGLYEIAKRENETKIHLAWVPYLNKYILGRVAFKSTMQGIILVIISIVGILSSTMLLFIKPEYSTIMGLAITTIVTSLVESVYTFIAHYKVFEKYSKSTVIMTILDVLSGGILGPFFIFAVRDNKENNEISNPNEKLEEKI